MYYLASYVGVYTDGSANHAYSGSKYNGTYEMSVSANSRWDNFLYNSDRTNNGCGFTLYISNNNNRLPTIRVNTSISIYESLIGYTLLNGPTLYYYCIHIIMAAGGGGIPMVKEEDGTYTGIDAVIDKDYAALELAKELDADYFLLLTGVEKVALEYGTPNQRDLNSLTIDEVKALMEKGAFEAGSILPKVHAACLFAEANPDGTAIITSLDKSKEALAGKTGTRIY